MPKEGFRSITVSEDVYDRFNSDYLKSKSDLAIRGVRSLSGYISYMLEERMREDEALSLHAPMMKKISVDDGRVVLLDNTINRIAEVVVQDGRTSTASSARWTAACMWALPTRCPRSTPC